MLGIATAGLGNEYLTACVHGCPCCIHVAPILSATAPTLASHCLPLLPRTRPTPAMTTTTSPRECAHPTAPHRATPHHTPPQVIGPYYCRDERNVFRALWEEIRDCDFVSPDKPGDKVYWYSRLPNAEPMAAKAKVEGKKAQ